MTWNTKPFHFTGGEWVWLRRRKNVFLPMLHICSQISRQCKPSLAKSRPFNVRPLSLQYTLPVFKHLGSFLSPDHFDTVTKTVLSLSNNSNYTSFILAGYGNLGSCVYWFKQEYCIVLLAGFPGWFQKESRCKMP